LMLFCIDHVHRLHMFFAILWLSSDLLSSLVVKTCNSAELDRNCILQTTSRPFAPASCQ
jgi:hypothetical protein